MNPFGVPITDAILNQMPRYKGKTITQEDLAREAMRLIGAGDKNLAALRHALDLKTSYGDGVSAVVLVYNATGVALEVAASKDWLGYVYHQEPPRWFQNGQWLAFLHVHPTSQALGCEAARVYRGRNVKGEAIDFMVAWSIPWGATNNSAYTEVREKDHFPHHWDYIKCELLEKAGKITRDQRDEYCASSTVSIGGYTTSEVIAILQHKFSPSPDELYVRNGLPAINLLSLQDEDDLFASK